MMSIMCNDYILMTSKVTLEMTMMLNIEKNNNERIMEMITKMMI